MLCADANFPKTAISLRLAAGIGQVIGGSQHIGDLLECIAQILTFACIELKPARFGR